jgi:hypothetical protein
MKAVDLLDKDTGNVFGVICYIARDIVTHLR